MPVPSPITSSTSAAGGASGFARWIPYVWLLLVAYFIADFAVLEIRSHLIPDGGVIVGNTRFSAPTPQFARSDWNSITSRNLFHWDGTIPPALSSGGGREKQQEEVPVPSTLPLGLIGTLVHSNPQLSLASVEVKNRQQNVAFSVGKEIDRIATVVRIERKRVILRNLNNGRLEFIEIKDNNPLNLSLATPAASSPSEGITRLAPDRFEISRTAVDAALSDLSTLVMQASSIPRKRPTGETDGFTIINIAPGSLYTQLGIQNNDVVTSVNGEKLDSPETALKLFNALKNSSAIQIDIERDGRPTRKEYNIR